MIMEREYESVLFVRSKGSTSSTCVEKIQAARSELEENLNSPQMRKQLLQLCDAVMKDVARRSNPGLEPGKAVDAMFNALIADFHDDMQGGGLRELMSSLNLSHFESLDLMILCMEKCRQVRISLS